MTAVVEGVIDQAVAEVLVTRAGGMLHRSYPQRGKSGVRRGLPGFNAAARKSRWLVMVDLDGEFECAPDLRAQWLPVPAPLMAFRVAVRAVESWLLADVEAMAQFLRVKPKHLPVEPEAVSSPKRALADAALHSVRREIRQDVAAKPGSGRVVGPAYTARVVEFVHRFWRPEVAASRSPSLARAVAAVSRLVEPAA